MRVHRPKGKGPAPVISTSVVAQSDGDAVATFLERNLDRPRSKTRVHAHIDRRALIHLEDQALVPCDPDFGPHILANRAIRHGLTSLA